MTIEKLTLAALLILGAGGGKGSTQSHPQFAFAS
jgi:hypothetical protein